MVKVTMNPVLVRKTKNSAPSRTGSTQNMSANLKVVVRVRPLNDKEMELNNRVIIDEVDNNMLVFDPKEENRPFFYQGIQQPNKNFLKRANKELKFVFDHVCGQNSTNNDIFEMTTKDMLTSLMEGYNCSVFAYGATGAGKTFTMIGCQEQPGITYLTMDHLFVIIDSLGNDRDFEIGVSYIEVYNENVFDLLNPSKTPLQLREDSKYGVMVAGLTVKNIRTARELLTMLESGNKNRTQHPTDANAESSRSHAVFQVYVKMRFKINGQVRMVKLSMIDLAGSERASATGCVGERFKEGANINRSLLALGNCINGLADGSAYIPYRDSKLTRLLKDSLGGNCKTVMIANISPSSVSYEDTYNTLKYAARANKIQLSIKKNIVDGDMKVSQYVTIIEELKKKVKELEGKLTASCAQAAKEADSNREKVEREWRRRVGEAERGAGVRERQVLALMCRQRVLALRMRLRGRAFSRVVDLAHRSSSEAMQQVCMEDIPRHGRATENCIKQLTNLEMEIMSSWTKWNESRKKLQDTLNKALSEAPTLQDFIENVKMKSRLRQLEISRDLSYKLLSKMNEEFNSVAEYTSEMPCMLKKLYLILKGYDKVPPALASEYLSIMKKAKPAEAITWSDTDSDCDGTDNHFKYIMTLDLEKPLGNPELTMALKKESECPLVLDDVNDVENIEPSCKKKRKVTPIKLINETITIDDSLEGLDVTKNAESAKKFKRNDTPIKPYDCEPIDPENLNSTFVLAQKMEAGKPEFKSENCKQLFANPPKGLVDRTNTAHLSSEKVKIVKPVVGKAFPQRRPISASAAQPKAGFGSSLARDGRTPLQKNAQAVRSRERLLTHPYSRPQIAARK